MLLTDNNDEAILTQSTRFTITLTWTMNADLDLAAIYEAQDGARGLIYFGELGGLETFPHIMLGGDQGAPGGAGLQQEMIEVARFDTMRRLWLLCWDYEKIEEGAPTRFPSAAIRLRIQGELDEFIEISPLDGLQGNVLLLAALDHANAGATKITNINKAALLNGLHHFSELTALIEG